MNTPSGHNAAVPTLITALLEARCYPHPVGEIRLIETHISWVLLTGDYAYKIKKPVDFGFLNFSTLELRKHYCEQELRLNRRYAPELYLEVVPITGTESEPRIGGTTQALEYALKMREFPQSALGTRALATGRLGGPQIDQFASRLAQFHAAAAAAPPDSDYGTPESISVPALQNFKQMVALTDVPSELDRLRRLQRWTERELAACRPAFYARKASGFVRDCHGDLHLGNIVLAHEVPTPFDCIEFNDELRWIDVMSEVAFLVMDLEDRGRRDLAWRFLNGYLEASGGYPGTAVLRFYLVYRSMVRAKVHLMRSQQTGFANQERARLLRAVHGYLDLAQMYGAPCRPALILTHGLSGCGKTTVTQFLLEAHGCIRLRSDLERKRLAGLHALAASGSTLAGGLYTADSSASTYRHLGEMAQTMLANRCTVIVDATFIKRSDREAMRLIANATGAALLILDFHAPLELLRARIAGRKAQANDASEADHAVLEHQIATRQPLTPAEVADAIVIDATQPPSAALSGAVRQRLAQVT